MIFYDAMNKFTYYSYLITTDSWGNASLDIPASDFNIESDLILNVTCMNYFVLYLLISGTNTMNIRLINNDQNRTNATNITRSVWVIVKKS